MGGMRKFQGILVQQDGNRPATRPDHVVERNRGRGDHRASRKERIETRNDCAQREQVSR